MELKDKIDLNRLPKHIAIIMDGNGRWAKQQGKERIFGHQNGVESVRDTTEAAAELGVKFLTLYAFSTENWNRPKPEVQALMSLLVESIRNELPELHKNSIRLQAIGNLQMLPPRAYERLMEAIEDTKDNNRMTLVLALSYSAKWELIQAVKNIAKDVQSGDLNIDDINEQLISDGLTTKGIPDPELLIRTSGETRVSNFLLWQIAYAELYFTEVFWPDFRKKDLYQAILNFQQRERRFGMTSEQLLSDNGKV
ncbi:MAG: isoprenyl transferase [Saprospiraceae bacterium]|nr:isoprenyl transferase [Saprospiraceae bacterium]